MSLNLVCSRYAAAAKLDEKISSGSTLCGKGGRRIRIVCREGVGGGEAKKKWNGQNWR